MSMSPGQKVLAGCGIAAIAAVACVILMIGGCGFLLFQSAANFPSWAQASVVNPANKDVTDRIEKIIADALSLGDARRKIAAETWPTKVVLISLREENSMPTEAFSRYPGMSSNSNFSVNGNGYGSVTTPFGKKDIAIIERPQHMNDSGGTITYTLYVEHSP